MQALQLLASQSGQVADFYRIVKQELSSLPNRTMHQGLPPKNCKSLVFKHAIFWSQNANCTRATHILGMWLQAGWDTYDTKGWYNVLTMPAGQPWKSKIHTRYTFTRATSLKFSDNMHQLHQLHLPCLQGCYCCRHHSLLIFVAITDVKTVQTVSESISACSYTVDPLRRILQHNGHLTGGAATTRRRYSCLIFITLLLHYSGVATMKCVHLFKLSSHFSTKMFVVQKEGGS